jgi:hypothetical protein
MLCTTHASCRAAAASSICQQRSACAKGLRRPPLLNSSGYRGAGRPVSSHWRRRGEPKRDGRGRIQVAARALHRVGATRADADSPEQGEEEKALADAQRALTEAPAASQADTLWTVPWDGT